MADTQVAAANVVEQWDESFFAEYNRADKLMPFHGTSEQSIIQVKENLTKKQGDVIHVQLVTQLDGSGVTGSSTLEGNEENLDNYGDEIQVDQLRHAVRFSTMEELKTTIDLRNAGKMMLRDWMANKKRDTLIDRFACPNLDGVTAYASCTEAQKDAWCAANQDRILFGNAVTNYSADHSAGLLNVDSTTDVLTAAGISLAKRRAKLADPAIRPVKLANGEEWFVAFAPSYAFRDLRGDNSILASRQYALERGQDNPLFSGGDIIWDGVIVKELEEIDSITGVGNGGIDVAPVFFCGAQALGIAWAQRTKTTTKTFDYDDKYGIAVAEIRGMKKLIFNSKQHGMLTYYVANVAD